MINFLGDDAIVGDEQCGFTFEVIDEKRQHAREAKPWSPLDAFNMRGFVSSYDGWNVFPYGENNDLPMKIRNTVYANSIVPGILSKKTGMNWGKGPKLYKEKFDDAGNLTRLYQDDNEVKEWLDTWDWEKYILKCAVSFSHIESYYTKIPFKRSFKLGEDPKVHSLIYIEPNKPMVVGRKRTPTHIMLEKEDVFGEYEVFPLLDKFTPNKTGVSVLYSNLPSFCSDFFSIPQILGSIPWIETSTNVPKFLNAMMKNSINIKYHITSPQEYWIAKRKEIQDACLAEGKPYREIMLKTFKRNMLKQIEKVLSGLENAGKFWHTEQVLKVEGANLIELGWKISTIDDKSKETVTSQIAIARMADQSSATGVGVHSALGNLGEQGKNGGGSEQYYALNNYMQTGIDIPEMVIMEAMNYALKINFPKKDLKMGLFHDEPKRQEEMSKEERGLVANR